MMTMAAGVQSVYCGACENIVG